MRKRDEPAYPVTDSSAIQYTGLTKLEATAIAAMGCFVLDDSDINKLQSGFQPDHALAAKFCVGFANALWDELEKENGQ